MAGTDGDEPLMRLDGRDVATNRCRFQVRGYRSRQPEPRVVEPRSGYVLAKGFMNDFARRHSITLSESQRSGLAVVVPEDDGKILECEEAHAMSSRQNKVSVDQY